MTYEIVRRAQYGDIYTYIDYDDGWYKLYDGNYINGAYVTTNVDTSKLNSSDATAYRYDDTAPMVATIQEWLKQLGYYTSDITGHYGTKTVEAVSKFQSDNGLTEDGVAGSKTIAKLQEKIAGGGSGSISVKGNTVYNIDWFTVKGISGAFSKLGLMAGKTAKLTDLNTGITINIRIQSTGNHVDAEPVTSSDTAKFCSMYGVSNASSITSSTHYQRRPMLIETSEGYKAVCSMYGVPHGQQVITNNNFNGQFCLHFMNSRTSRTNKVDSGHQTAIGKAITIVQNEGATVTTLKTAP
ncbi:MAG: peptidoglycan-binding protein [Clostridia bacterium]|nr:peptidoglycan-binding protein [Clostridia bacterium]